MKLFLCGDVVGRSGREAVLKHLPALRKERGIDFAVVDGCNAAGGFGITPDICQDFFKAGADVITGGDHIWDQREIIPLLAQEKRLLRPHNFPDTNPGTGLGVYKISGKTIVVLHLLGQVFLKDNLDCPFRAADKALQGYKLGNAADAIIVDMHGEATSEKMAMGRYLDGRVSMVVGSHTHVPTADARILNGGTAYQTDAGMCGDYDSIIGFQEEGPLARFLTKIQKHKMEAATGEASFCGVLVETDDKTGLAKSIEPVRIGGKIGK